jgi:hypothetical protein
MTKTDIAKTCIDDRPQNQWIKIKPSLDTQLSALEDMTLDDLHLQWRRTFKTEPPRLGRSMLALALGYELQCRARGNLSLAMRSMLLGNTCSSGKKSLPIPKGERLIRSWQGQTYVVEVGEDSVIRWNNRDWRSLSEVARAITGTRWSGPAFFGLRAKKQCEEDTAALQVPTLESAE